MINHDYTVDNNQDPDLVLMPSQALRNERPYGVQWTMYVVENNWKTPFIPKGENVAIKFLIVQQFHVMLIENYPK